jgi:hypothetical protein
MEQTTRPETEHTDEWTSAIHPSEDLTNMKGAPITDELTEYETTDRIS